MRYKRVPKYHRNTNLRAAGAAIPDPGAQGRQRHQAAIASAYADSRLNLVRALDRAAADFKDDFDAYQATVAKMRSPWLARLPEAIRPEAETYFDTQAAAPARAIYQAGAARDDKHHQAVLTEAVGTATQRAKAAALRGDAATFQSEAKNADALRHQLLQTGLITADQFVEYGRDLADELEQAALLGRYEAARQEGRAGEFIANIRRSVSEDQAETLLRRYRADLSAEDSARRAAETAEAEALKQSQAAVYTQLVEGLADGSTDYAAIDHALERRDISAGDAAPLFPALHRMTPTRTDPQMLADLCDRLDDDAFAPEQKTRLALDACRDGLITRADLDQYRDDLAAIAHEAPAVRNYRRYLQDRITRNAALSDGDTAQRRLSALQEFNARIRAGDDPGRVAGDILARDRLTALEAMPSPRFLTGAKGDLNALEAARRATGAALQQGRITPARAAREATLLKRLMEIAHPDNMPMNTRHKPETVRKPGDTYMQTRLVLPTVIQNPLKATRETTKAITPINGGYHV